MGRGREVGERPSQERNRQVISSVRNPGLAKVEPLFLVCVRQERGSFVPGSSAVPNRQRPHGSANDDPVPRRAVFGNLSGDLQPPRCA